ncbi:MULTISPECIES: carbohydrate-binding protein [unclassified Lentimonas]|uniref:carbohydrate-binding protein n=1 Tax=unclassified Lentimonas TaxID=2630993 RepID=UPI0013253E44|nr:MULTISPECIES: carbohydrate-binding protein [unclassified Lentimonas]CAA6679329.1 Unannotated [Lentimonas sp. CC4]CAA6686366.1 Unannotated [Lentimonas sp. CC6]CAA7076140.1 Unannotated [Lentimonas sp. CC4]CAA7170867.1 Unannotated [Lentimonas sp. CC21]CAA7181191.1 Unannotated [Lentimonas sp. CC8]
MPEVPLIDRDTLILTTNDSPTQESDRAFFTQSTMGNYRTTRDGRIALHPGAQFIWNIVAPEKLSKHFVDTDPLTDGFNENIFIYEQGPRDSNKMGVMPTRNMGGVNRNISQRIKKRDGYSDAVFKQFAIGDVDPNSPYAEFDVTHGWIDVYKFYVYSYVQVNGNGPLDFRMNATEVKVKNPKTANAEFISIRPLPSSEWGGRPERDFMDVLGDVPPFLEPVVTADGQLLVVRINKGNWQYNHPNTGAPTAISYTDIVYAYSSDGTINGDPNDPTDGFDNLIPFSVAPYDKRINGEWENDGDPNTSGTTYGLAVHKFRDSFGNVIPEDGLFGGTYPWVDFKGDNIVFTTFQSNLNIGEDPVTGSKKLGVNPRYNNASRVAGADETFENSDPKMGFAVVGLWTRGKIIMMDNLINNIDYGIRKSYEYVRDTELYSDPVAANRWRLLGSGNSNGDGGDLNKPVAAGQNTAFFDSMENIFGYNEKMHPTLPYDVVWWVQDGVTTAQFPFDDYLNPNGFIVSRMNVGLEYLHLTNASNHTVTLKPHDGWDWVNDEFNAPVRFDNAATASPLAEGGWDTPQYGEAFPVKVGYANTITTNGVRVEPLANGGVHGKGVWLEDQWGVKYTVPNNGSKADGSNWYIGVFVDCRFSDGSDSRLLTFPDATEVSLTRMSGDDKVVIRQGGVLIAEFLVPDLNGWAHLGIQVMNAGKMVELYHNGFLLDYFEHSSALFQMNTASGNPGTLYLGSAQDGATSFRGWLDDFKVFAQSFDPEVCANHAGATLVGVESNTALANQAALYPELSHDNITFQLAALGGKTYARYAAYYDYTGDNKAHRFNLPAGVHSVRDDLLFPEAPLFHDGKRPESSFNMFCLNCHASGEPQGLGLDALAVNDALIARDDPRRQPMQPEPYIRGYVPQDYFVDLGYSATNSALVDSSSDGDRLIDRYILETLDPTVRTINSYTVYGQNQGADINLDNLSEGGVFNYAEYADWVTDPSSLAIVANPDAAQGSLVIDWVAPDSTGSVTRNDYPFTLFADDIYAVGEYPKNGQYTLTTTPYRNANGGGVSGVVGEISFRIKNMPVKAISFDYEPGGKDLTILPLKTVQGDKLGHTNSSWMRFDNFDFGTGAQTLTVRYATKNNNTRIEFRDGSDAGPIIASITTPSTGDWDAFQLRTMILPETVVGVKDLVVKFVGAVNLDTFQFIDTWTSEDIGSVTLPGAFTESSLKVIGNGDVWGQHDSFHFVHKELSGDFTMTARLAAFDKTARWSKAGIMIRDTLATDSLNIMTLLTDDKKIIRTQYRDGDQTSDNTQYVAHSSPGSTQSPWFRLQRVGNSFTSSYSQDGTTWMTSTTMTIPMSGDVYVGLAVSSQNNDLATANFANVTISE